jgi:predicted NBD/HSP70 family sugar kinase
MPARIGIDTGGTFTDVVRWQRDGVRAHKVPSTPGDPSRAVLTGLAAVRATADEAVDVVHGTTVGLISHVGELASQIPAQIRVIPGAGGKSTVRAGTMGTL